ncbi:MAG: DUF4160 domain-containing protein [Solirubrobacteraceae bacterium]
MAIDALELIDGWLPPRALRLVVYWAGQHQAELRNSWDRARAHEALVGIDPLPEHQSPWLPSPLSNRSPSARSA